MELFLLTLPYYSSVGFLFDSEDLEFYLEKANPAYRVPRTFKRVAPRGQPITEVLFLVRDPDDQDSASQPVMPRNV